MRVILSITTLFAVACFCAAGPDNPATKPAPIGNSPEALLKVLGKNYRPYVEVRPEGQIDWTRGEILAQGVGKVRGSGAQAVAMGHRAAQLLAARNAILLVSGIRVNPDGRFLDVRKARISVEGVLRDFEESALQYDPVGRTVTVTLRAPLYGAYGVVRMSGLRRAASKKFLSWGEGELREKPAAVPADLIVIDARRTRFVPVLFPRVETETRQSILPSAKDPKGKLVRRRLVVYATTSEPAVTAKLAGKPGARVLLLRAVQGKAKTLVLDKSELDKLQAHPNAKALISTGKVVILVSKNR